jgi:hypothetical protein
MRDGLLVEPSVWSANRNQTEANPIQISWKTL